MRNMFESPEIFGAYAEIDFAMYMLQDLINSPHPNSAKNNIDAIIDKATGYDKVMDIESIDAAIGWLEVIVENKKIIEADYENSQKAIIELKELKNKLQCSQ